VWVHAAGAAYETCMQITDTLRQQCRNIHCQVLHLHCHSLPEHLPSCLQTSLPTQRVTSLG
jgi:hypothetical protein